MKNKKNNKKRSRPLIGLLAILVSLSVGIVLSSENTQTAVTAQPAVKPGFWSNLKEKAADKYKQAKNYIEQNAEIQAAKKKGEELYNEAKTKAKELASGVASGAKELASGAYAQVRNAWVNDLLPVLNKAGQEIVSAFSTGLTQSGQVLVHTAVAPVTNLAAKSIQGIQDVSNSVQSWANKNLSPEKAQQLMTQVGIQAGAAVQGVTNQAQQAATTAAENVSKAAQSLQPGEPMTAPVG